MIEELTITIPTVVDVTLYKYNHIDNRFMTLLKNQVDYRPMNDDSFLITRNQLKAFIELNYQRELNKIKSTGAELFHKEVNTIFFLNQMVLDFKNLQYIKFSINKDKAYSRLIEIDGQKVIKFNFKILTGTFKLYEVFTNKELAILNRILVETKILKEDVPYATVETMRLINVLEDYLVKFEQESDDALLVNDLLDLLDSKVEMDNPKLLLITDY